MGELLFELVLKPLGELIGYAAGFVLVPALTLGSVRAERLRSQSSGHNWAGVRRREDGVLVLSHEATAVWGIFLIIGIAVALAFLTGGWQTVANCPPVTR